jgi:hypothetical protein
MADQELRVDVTGRIGDHIAQMLGGRVEETPDGFTFITPYLDQAQVTGLLMRLDDLHIGFHQVTVTPPVTNNNDTTEGAQP